MDDTRWDLERLEGTLTVTLWPAWGQPPVPWWSRLVGAKAREMDPIGTVSITTNTIEVRRSAQDLVAIDWSRPFALHLGWWPYEGSSNGELTMVLASGADEIRVRTVWPGSAIAAHVPIKQDSAPFVEPKQFQGLWRAAAGRAGVLSLRVPPGLDVDVPDSALDLLCSVGDIARCASCESANLVWKGPEVYRCFDCRYKGGDGLAAQIVRQRRRELRQGPIEGRRAKAREDLREARELLDSAATMTIYSSNEKILTRTVNRQAKMLIKARQQVTDACHRDQAIDDVLSPVLQNSDEVWSTLGGGWEQLRDRQKVAIDELLEAVSGVLEGEAGPH